MRLLSVTVVVTVLLVSNASAQSGGPWLIVPVETAKEGSAFDASIDQLVAALEREKVRVLDAAVAAERFEREESRPATELSASELRRWNSLSRGAVDDLAEGETKRAFEKLNAAQELSREAIEELNRDPERARRVFDTCLYNVRAVLATEGESRARSVARECRRLVPRAEPSPYMHPPSVTELLSEIDALQAKQGGGLRVESTPSGCAARLNGVLLGETPVTIGNVFPGEYRIQVECEPSERGRVHAVKVGAGRAERKIDSRFDGVVRSRPGLALRYARASDLEKHRDGDAGAMARAVSAGSVVMVMTDGEAMTFRRVAASGEGTPLSLVRIAAGEGGPDASDVSRAAASLAAGECVDLSSGKRSALDCGRAPVAMSAGAAAVPSDGKVGRRPRGQFISGMTLIGVGIAALGTGYALLIPRSSAAEDWVTQVDDDGDSAEMQVTDVTAQQRWLDLGGAIVITGSIGSAALVTAMPLALPGKEKTPPWAWASGGVGLGLAAFSIAWGVTATSVPSGACEQGTIDFQLVRDCVKRGEEVTLSILTGLTAAPLITMPLVYLLRPSRSRLEPQVQAGRGFGYMGVRGRF